MSKLPEIHTTIETLVAKQDAVDTVDEILKRINELEDIHTALQPLLYTLSVALYGDDDKPVSLHELIADACAFINNYSGATRH